jgi:anti-anti-sigma regulatory factor
MQVDIHWEDRDRNIIRVNCAGSWNWADMAEGIRKWRIAQPSPLENTCIVVDLRGITSMPSDAVLHLKDAATSSREVHGRIVVIISSSAIAVLFKMFTTMYWKVGGKFIAASSEAEAYKLLGIPSIPTSPPQP